MGPASCWWGCWCRWWGAEGRRAQAPPTGAQLANDIHAVINAENGAVRPLARCLCLPRGCPLLHPGCPETSPLAEVPGVRCVTKPAVTYLSSRIHSFTILRRLLHAGRCSSSQDVYAGEARLTESTRGPSWSPWVCGPSLEGGSSVSPRPGRASPRGTRTQRAVLPLGETRPACEPGCFAGGLEEGQEARSRGPSAVAFMRNRKGPK